MISRLPRGCQQQQLFEHFTERGAACHHFQDALLTACSCGRSQPELGQFQIRGDAGEQFAGVERLNEESSAPAFKPSTLASSSARAGEAAHRK